MGCDTCRKTLPCPLCDKSTFKFHITFCKIHSETPMIVHTQHKQEFSIKEKQAIEKMFPDRKIRFEMKSIKDHSHCHIEGRKDELKTN